MSVSFVVRAFLTSGAGNRQLGPKQRAYSGTKKSKLRDVLLASRPLPCTTRDECGTRRYMINTPWTYFWHHIGRPTYETTFANTLTVLRWAGKGCFLTLIQYKSCRYYFSTSTTQIEHKQHGSTRPRFTLQYLEDFFYSRQSQAAASRLNSDSAGWLYLASLVVILMKNNAWNFPKTRTADYQHLCP